MYIKEHIEPHEPRVMPSSMARDGWEGAMASYEGRRDYAAELIVLFADAQRDPLEVASGDDETAARAAKRALSFSSTVR